MSRLRAAGLTPERVYVIAEIGSVHDGSFGNALNLIEAAAECGADAVKLQTHIAAAETLRDAPTPSYFTGEPRYEYFERTSFSEEQLRRLRAHAEGHGVEFLSSPFSVEAVDLLERVGVGRYKIPSGEVTNLPLLEAAARTGKQVILSSGMSSWAELDRAVETIRRRSDDIAVLQCTSEYPCPPERVGLNVLGEIAARYGTPVGLSDHTMGYAASLAAVMLGGRILERHFTFSRKMYGSDAKHSLTPEEMMRLVNEIRDLERMLANPVEKSDVACFEEMRTIFQKSLVARVEIPEGEVITREMIAILKPGTGLEPAALPRVLGRRSRRHLPANTILQETDIDWASTLV